MELFVPGPVGRLEARLDPPSEKREPRAAALLCHPHPEHGGTYRNTVVHRTMRGLTRAGLAVLRFNFRGVEQSAGSHDGAGGEVDDAAAALEWLAQRYPGLALWGAGFSFGARTMFALALREPRIRRVILVGFPSRSYRIEGLDRLAQPTYFQCAANDEHGNLADLRAQLPDPPPHYRFDEIPDTNHFFLRETRELEERILRYANEAYARESLDA